MPKYTYKCNQCEEVSEKVHSMSEKMTDCETCKSKDTLVKIPTLITTQYKDSAAGKIVDEHIKEAKEELEAEKQRLQHQDYEND